MKRSDNERGGWENRSYPCRQRQVHQAGLGLDSYRCDFCEFALDTRFVPGMNPKEVLKKIRSVIKSETDKFKIEIDDFQLPYEIDRNHPFVKTYLKTARKMGCKAIAKGSEGATVMTFFKKHKIPAFATGFGAHGTAHTNDEYIFIKSLYQGTKVLEQFIKEYDRL